jgi:hypothetical protein
LRRYELGERRQAPVPLERRQQIGTTFKLQEALIERTLTEGVDLPGQALEPRGGHANGLCRQAVAPGLELEEGLAGGFEAAHEHIGRVRLARVLHRSIDRRGLSLEGRLSHFWDLLFEVIPHGLANELEKSYCQGG